MTTDTNEQIFRTVIDRVFCRGGLDSIDALFSPQLVDHEQGSPGRDQGRDGVRWVVQLLRGAFPDLRVTIEDMVSVGDRTWARLRYRGTNAGPFMGHPATGRHAEWEGIAICRYEDGRIVEQWGVVDRLGGLQQLGIAPAPGAGHGAGLTGPSPSPTPGRAPRPA